MTPLATGSVVRQIESLFDGSAVAGLTDRQLLERFTTQRDAGAEVAFTAMVARHGPVVLGICRQVLGDRHHAEDAFQAVFLVLACKARSIRNPDLVGSWLYGVALRTAHKVKTRLGHRRKIEEGDAMSVSGAVTMVVTPGPAALNRNTVGQGRLAAHQGALAEIDPTNYGNGPVSEIQGRIAFPALIPGAAYRIIDRTVSRETGPEVRKEFTVKPSEKVDLGDILIEKPQIGK